MPACVGNVARLSKVEFMVLEFLYSTLESRATLGPGRANRVHSQESLLSLRRAVSYDLRFWLRIRLNAEEAARGGDGGDGEGERGPGA